MALIDELLAATAAAEILRHVARATWAKAHGGAEFPPARVPTLADLGAAALPFEAVQEAVARSSAAAGIPAPQLMVTPPAAPNDPPLPSMPGGMALYWTWLPVRTAHLAPAPDPKHPGGPIEAVHAAWRAAEPQPRHPLAPLVDAWHGASTGGGRGRLRP